MHEDEVTDIDMINEVSTAPNEFTGTEASHLGYQSRLCWDNLINRHTADNRLFMLWLSGGATRSPISMQWAMVCGTSDKITN